MFCDCLSLCVLAREIREAAEGGRVADVRQSADLSLLIRLRRGPVDARVVLSAEAQWARVHLAEGSFEAVSPPPGFCERLRPRLSGARLRAVQQVQLDRVLEFEFLGRDDLGDARTFYLVAELMGKHSNLILLDGERRIVDAIKRVPARLNRHRVVLPRKEYVPPPRSPMDLSEATAESVAGALRRQAAAEPETTCEAVIRKLVPGLGRLLVREVCCLASASPTDPVGPEEVRLHDCLGYALVGIVQTATSTARQSAVLVPGAGAGGAPGLAPFPLRSRPEATPWEDGSMSSLVAHCAEAERAARHTQGGQSVLLCRARSVLKRLKQQRVRLAAELRKADGAEVDRRKGQAILVSLGEIAKGATRVELDCPETGERLTVELRPEQTPAANAQRYFDRHAKRRRAAQRLPSAIAEGERHSERVAELLARAEQGGDAEAEQELTKLLDEETKSSLTVRQRGSEEQRRFIRQRLKSGHEAVIGRSARENEVLLSQVARPNDLWFHARGLPGPHGLLRSQDKSRPVPPEALREMARLMARRGKARRETTVAVDFAPAKHVRKVKGGRPGAVTYTHHKTLFVKNQK